MEQKIIFRELLGELRQKAEEAGNKISREAVETYLSHVQLTKEQLDLVCDYLQGMRIRVDGYDSLTGTAKGNETGGLEEERAKEEEGGFGEEEEGGFGEKRGREEESGFGEERGREEESGFGEERGKKDKGGKPQQETQTDGFSAYLKEVSLLQEPDPDRELDLFERCVAKDKEAMAQLAQMWLALVCELAGECDSQEISVEDLIQEGNMGLWLALENLEKQGSLAAYRAHLLNEVNKALSDAILADRRMRELDEGTIKQINHLNEAIRSLEEDLGRRVSLEELSAFLEVPAERIADLLLLAGDALEVEPDGSGSGKNPWER